MELLIGCPVYRRAWSIKAWYEHAAVSADKAGLEPTFILVGDELNDKETFDAFRSVSRHDLIIVSERETGDGRRDWSTPGRYERMVYLRNRLLNTVRAAAPTMFLSLDSDILMHPDALGLMVDAPWDGVGSKTYMASGRTSPSYAMLSNSGRMQRPDADGTFRVDAIMAIKLMRRAAYHVNYEWHRHGEDIGYSLACAREGVTLGWVGSVCSKHLMRSEQLHLVDDRCGF